MKVLKKIFLGILILLGILFLSYLLGPRMQFEHFDNVPLEGRYSIEEVENSIARRNQTPEIKPDNEERIIWMDGKKITEYSIIYLHGFSASQGEGAPIHTNIARRYGANIYLSRLPKHGLKDVDAFADLSPKMMVDYAKEAIKIGKSIGKKVIIISCSTGGTLSSYLAAADDEIFAQIMFSPNFEMHDQTTKLLTKPWGLQIARTIKKGNYHEWNTPQVARPYWYHKYRLEGVIALQSLVDRAVSEDNIKAIEHPLFVGYFYESDTNKDFTVSIDKILEVKEDISTPEEDKVFKAYPDGNAHVFISPYFNDNWTKVQEDVYEFLESKLDMSPVVQKVLIEN